MTSDCKKCGVGWPRDKPEHAFEPMDPTIQPRIDHIHLACAISPADIIITKDGPIVRPASWLAISPPAEDPGIGLVLVYEYKDKWPPGHAPLIVGIAEGRSRTTRPWLLQTTMPVLEVNLRAIGVSCAADWRRWWQAYSQLPPKPTEGVAIGAETTSAGDGNTVPIVVTGLGGP